MKLIEITKRERHILMSILRVVHSAFHDEAGGVHGPALVHELSIQPGMSVDLVPKDVEIDSLLERISDNEVT